MAQREIQVHERPPLQQSIPLGLQHLFAMFGSTVLVPIIFGVNPATVLLMNGIGTILISTHYKRTNSCLFRFKFCFYFTSARRP